MISDSEYNCVIEWLRQTQCDVKPCKWHNLISVEESLFYSKDITHVMFIKRTILT